MTGPEMTANRPSAPLPSVSVLLPAWNEAGMIARCLNSLQSIDWPDLEIIVCAGGQDGTLERAQSYAGQRVTVLLQHSGEGKQGALRRCYLHSRGEIIYLTDADCVIPDESFRTLLRPILESRFEVATGSSVPLEEQTFSQLVRYQWGKEVAWALHLSVLAPGVHGRNFAIRRETLEQVGAFNADVPSGTDYHLSQRLRLAGIPIAWTESVVHSKYPAHAVPYVRMWRRWIKNVLVQGIQTRSYREVMTTGLGVASSATLLGLLVLSVVVARRAMLPWMALLGLISYRRLKDHRRLERARVVPPIERAAVSIPVFVLLDAIAAVSGLVAAVIPSMRRAW